MTKIMNWKTYCLVAMCIIATLLLYINNKYSTKHLMQIAIKEYNKQTYPDDPANKLFNYGKYSYKELILTQNDKTHFTFTFVPNNINTATLILKNIDVSLMTPSIPNWIKTDPNLIRIALTDRQWNRQQVSFDPKGNNIEFKGGDGFGARDTYVIELAKNCLNAGLWEILLSSHESGRNKLYYQGWFTFPLGYYKELLTYNTSLKYYHVWYYLEHWFDPNGTYINLVKLRSVLSEKIIPIVFNRQEYIVSDGEQVNKAKNIVNSSKIKTYNDYYTDSVAFSTFSPPGIYIKRKPWRNQYWRIGIVKNALMRNIISRANPNQVLQELEITYLDKNGIPSSFYLSGFELKKLPKADIYNYSKGNLYLMGIGTPPLKQSYTDLQNNPPDKSPIFSFLLTKDNKWINHHELAVDGSILFIDKIDDKKLHVLLVSYERHAIVAHYMLNLNNYNAQERKIENNQ